MRVSWLSLGGKEREGEREEGVSWAGRGIFVG